MNDEKKTKPLEICEKLELPATQYIPNRQIFKEFVEKAEHFDSSWSIRYSPEVIFLFTSLVSIFVSEVPYFTLSSHVGERR